jgi:hypothetical protein
MVFSGPRFSGRADAQSRDLLFGPTTSQFRQNKQIPRASSWRS